MRKSLISTGLSAALIVLSGCVTTPPAASELLPPPRPLGDGLPSNTASPMKQDALQVLGIDEPSGTLSLGQSLALALVNNPNLAAFSAEVRAAEARMLQASLWPNPELGAEVENFGGTGPTSGFRAAEGTLSVSQMICSLGKIKKRTQVARLNAQLAGWDYETARLDVFTDVAHSFVDVLAAQERLDTAQETFALAQRVYVTISKQVEAGAASPIEGKRAKVELSTSRIDLKRAEHALQSSRTVLAATWGGKDPVFESASGTLASVNSIPDFSRLARLVEQNPDVERWTAEMAMRDAELKLAKAEIYPDITAMGGARKFREDDSTAAVAGLSLPLPLFNRNQGRIRETRENLNKAAEQKRAAEVSAHSKLSQAYQRLLAAHEEVTTLKTETLPAAQSAFDDVSQAYTEGKFNYLNVLDTQRTLFAVQFRYLDALVAYHQGVADVERLIGQPLDALK